MTLATLACPHCGYSKDLDQALLPRSGTAVRCPKCRGQFPLKGGDAPAATEHCPPLEQSLAIPAAGLQAAPQPTRHSNSDAPGAPLPPAPHSPPPLAQAAASEHHRTLTFSFTGNAREYFGIWVVNTLLRIVTLGIYSPWAKVRRRRYFYGNTLLDDANFDFLADPLAILKGWFIAGIFFGLYSFASRTSPVVASVMMLAFMGISPWVMVRSRIFNLRNSSHRNIRFSFRPNYREAYQVFLWWWILVPLTLGVMTPYVVYRQRRFMVENSSFGSTAFSFDATAKQYYRVFLPVLILVPLIAAATAAAWWLGKGGAAPLMPLVPALLLFAVYLVAALYLPTALTNVTWNATGIGEHRFESRLRVIDLAWIQFSSALAIICSLGLLAPWASVRLARYRLGKLTLSGAGSLDAIIAADSEAMGATGEELSDMLGFDLGL